MDPRHLALAALLLAFAAPAAADCTWEWLCNADGACKQMPVCGSVYENPPPRPNETKAPTIPPLTMRYNTFSGRGARPDTPLTCEHIMRKDRTGRWFWAEACFCADPALGKDPTAPFANIVKCDNGNQETAAKSPETVGRKRP
jgi:hypothetical protein